jgi:hypothetical protein
VLNERVVSQKKKRTLHDTDGRCQKASGDGTIRAVLKKVMKA